MMKVPQTPMSKHCIALFFVNCNLLFLHQIEGKAFAFHLDYKYLSTLCISNHAMIVLKQHLIVFFQQLTNTQQILINLRNILDIRD